MGVTDTACGSFVPGGQELRRLRQMVGLTAREVAARIHYSPAAVVRWELGERRLPRAVWHQLMLVFLAEQQDQEAWHAFVATFTAPLTAARGRK